MKIRHILNSLHLITLGLLLFVSSSYFILIIPLIGVCFALNTFIQDKQDLKASEIYIRVKKQHRVGKFLILIVVVILLLVFFYSIPENYLEKLNSIVFMISFILISLSDLLESNYINFVSAIRSYDDGIKLPGRNSVVLPWNNITELDRTQKVLSLLVSDEKITYTILEKDLVDCDQMINKFEATR